MVEVKVDAKGTIRAIGELIKQLPNSSAVGVNDLAKYAAGIARVRHRYNNRTGNLSHSVRIRRKKYESSIYIDEARAPYGVYVHNGTRRWAPDRYIPEAIEIAMNDAQIFMAKALNKVIRKLGLSGRSMTGTV